jgi:sugar O-acyltransferase (sialic acid O-acetyltransferase NeuD family)
MNNSQIYVLGIGNNTPVYIDLLQRCGYTIMGLYHYDDSKNGENFFGYEVISSTDELFDQDNLSGRKFALSMGNNSTRETLYNKILSMGGDVPTIIDPTAFVSKYSKLGRGVVVHANSVVQADSSIGNNTVISYNASVSHSSIIGDSCYIAFGATIGAYVNIQDRCFVGQSAAIVSGKVSNIGRDVLVGAGSVVVKDIAEGMVVMGNPARLINN